MSRRLLAFAAAAAIVVAGSAAYGASITFTTPHLGATSLPVPVFYPNSVVAANKTGGTVRKLEIGDTLTIVFSKEMSATTLCAGAPTSIGTQSSTGITITMGNNNSARGYDTMTVASVATSICTDGLLNVGTFDLGSAGYMTSTTGSFTNSTVALTETATSSTIVITLGTAVGTYAQVASGLAGIYTPVSTVTDVPGDAAGSNTGVTTATTQF